MAARDAAGLGYVQGVAVMRAKPNYAMALPPSLVLLAALSACGSSSSDPPPKDSSTSGGSIAGASSGFGSSGGASGKSSSGSNGATSGTVPSDLTDTSEESFDVDGTTHTYLLTKPKNVDANKKYPLVLNLHGHAKTPADEHTLLPFDSASGDQAIIAYPAATDGSDWDLNLPADNPDIKLLKALIDELEGKANIDKSRVLGFGFNSGAYFLSQVSCRVEGMFKMVSIVSGGAAEGSDDEKRPNGCVKCPAPGIPTFISHGQDDKGDFDFGSGDFARLCAAEQNGCQSGSLHNDGDPCQSYNGCPDGKKVEWCPVPNSDGPWQGSMRVSWNMFSSL